MGTRKVYIDFGSGFEDISAYVKYDTLVVTSRCSNDTFHYAQNTASFSTIYDDVLYNKFLSAEEDMPVRIVDVIDNACLTTENDWFLTTENSFNICTESGVAVPIFYGHIPPTRSRTYNGILNNTIMSFSATDDLDYLDGPVGDVYFSNCAIYDATNPANSIVHRLAAIRGFSSDQLSPSVSIPTVIERFAPEDETDSVLTLMDTLLYEYGYTLNMSENSIITPIKWAISTDDVPSYTFDDNNIEIEVNIEDSIRDYDGVKIAYHELKQAEDVLLYMDDNCTYTDDGSFAGYVIPAGYSYPPETNVIDDTTGLDTVVYQEYTEDSINYWTNKAVKNNLDYNRSAFTSDYSSMVVTENHWLDSSYDTGIVPAFAPVFLNKKCQIKYENPTADGTLKLYYNNVYGDVWYRGTEKTSTIDLITNPTNVNEYSSQFIFGTTYADNLAKSLAAMYSIHKTVYTFLSSLRVSEGTYATVSLSDGTVENCKIQSRKWNEKQEQYEYELIAVSDSVQTITRRTTSVTVSIASTEGVITSELSKDSITVNANADGSNPDLTLANTRMYVYRDGLDVSMDWTYSASVTGVTGSFGTLADKNLFTVSGFTSNSTTIGYVTITASRTGWDSQSLTFIITKTSIADISTVVSSYTPKYLGIGILTASNNATFTGASVSGSGVITVGSAITAKAGDYMINYASTYVPINVYVWNGSTWNSTSDSAYLGAAAVDLCNLQVGGITVSGFTVYITALVKTLFAQQATILDPGYIKSSNYSSGVSGFNIASDGSAEFNDVAVRGEINATSGTFSGDITATAGAISYTGLGYQTTIDGSGLTVFKSTSGGSLASPNNNDVKMVIRGANIMAYKYVSATTSWDKLSTLGEYLQSIEVYASARVSSTAFLTAYRQSLTASTWTTLAAIPNIGGATMVSFESYYGSYGKIGFIAWVYTDLDGTPGIYTSVISHVQNGTFPGIALFLRVSSGNIQIQNTAGSIIYACAANYGA